MSNLPAKSEPDSNEHLLRRSLGIVGEEAFESDHSEALDAENIVDLILSDPDVTQHVTRRHCDGVDSITGYFRCLFEASQERAILHVPIHPPMISVPDVEALFVEEDDSFRIRVTDRQKFGARLEIIRSARQEQAGSVMVEVILTASIENSTE